MKRAIAGIVIIGIGILIAVGTVTAINHIKREGFPIVNQPAIQSGNQAVISCEDGIVHMDGIAKGKFVTVKWASPAIGQSDMTKTLYCLWGNIRVTE